MIGISRRVAANLKPESGKTTLFFEDECRNTGTTRESWNPRDTKNFDEKATPRHSVDERGFSSRGCCTIKEIQTWRTPKNFLGSEVTDPCIGSHVLTSLQRSQYGSNTIRTTAGLSWC